MNEYVINLRTEARSNQPRRGETDSIIARLGSQRIESPSDAYGYSVLLANRQVHWQVREQLRNIEKFG